MSSDIRAILYDGGTPITPTDTTPATGGPYAGFYVGVAGDVTVTTPRGDKFTLKACNAGVVYTIATTIIWATGTTATNIIALKAANDVR